MMDYNVLWFILIGVLFTGFFFLEGFDYGVGMLMPFLTKQEAERSQILATIAPVWDGNEVWMITAGGAMFAAFPHVYATMFSSFYMALFLMLIALILRGAAFELRHCHESLVWQQGWDKAICFGSAVPAFLWGVAMTDLLVGLPIGQNMVYQGTFFDLLSPYSILGGLMTLCLFAFHGANFLALKLDNEPLCATVRRTGLRACLGAFILAVILIIAPITKGLLSFHSLEIVLFVLAAVLLLASALDLLHHREKRAFVATGGSIILLTAGFFLTMFPRLMVSSLNPDWSLTITNAASSEYTLSIMTVAALCLVLVVLIYQGWTYWTFRHRITIDTHHEY